MIILYIQTDHTDVIRIICSFLKPTKCLLKDACGDIFHLRCVDTYFNKLLKGVKRCEITKNKILGEYRCERHCKDLKDLINIDGSIQNYRKEHNYIHFDSRELAEKAVKEYIYTAINSGHQHPCCYGKGYAVDKHEMLRIKRQMNNE